MAHLACGLLSAPSIGSGWREDIPPLEWGIPNHAALERLTGIACPTLILQGDDDLMIPTKASHLMAGVIPNAELRIYPDAAHASIFQYPTEAAQDVNGFLG